MRFCIEDQRQALADLAARLSNALQRAENAEGALALSQQAIFDAETQLAEAERRNRDYELAIATLGRERNAALDRLAEAERLLRQALDADKYDWNMGLTDRIEAWLGKPLLRA